MTTVHDEYLELAAASIDFELSETERAALAAHLAECISCRRRVMGLQADQLAVAQSPSFVLAPESVDQVRGRIHRSGSPARPPLRLLAVAAILALIAVAGFTVGAELLRRDRDRDLSVVPPTSPIESPTSSTGPNASPALKGLAAGSIVDVVASGLRVRTLPTVDNSKSVKLDPLLGVGTQLQIIEGPVTADDYDWYLVQAIGLPHRGWVAAADHDGSPWIEDPRGRVVLRGAIHRRRDGPRRRPSLRRGRGLRPQAEGPAGSSHGRRRMQPEQRPSRAHRRVPFS